MADTKDSWTPPRSLEEITPEIFDLRRPVRSLLADSCNTAERFLSLLAMGDRGPTAWGIDTFDHSLQTATRAFRNGEDDEYVVMSLLHDCADGLSPEHNNHGELVAMMIGCYLSEANNWILKLHVEFQDYHRQFLPQEARERRQRWQGHPQFAATCDFCRKYDQASFDVTYDNMPLNAFRPLVHALFSRPPVPKSLW